MHLGGVSLAALPAYDLIWSTGDVIAVGNATLGGLRWRLSHGMASCGWLAANGTAAGEELGSCSVSVYCGGSHGNVACLGNVHGMGMPSWSPAAGAEDVLLVLHARSSGGSGGGTIGVGGVPRLADVDCEHRFLAMGHFMACAMLCDGSLWCWGSLRSHIALPSSSNTRLPVRIPFESWDKGPGNATASIMQLSAGAHHTCGLFAGGSLYCWGANTNGQIGVNRNSTLEPPCLVITAGRSIPIVQIQMLAYASFAVLEDGSLWAWGENHRGQLGLGYNSDWSAPKRVNSSRWDHGGTQTGISVLSGFSFHACAIPQDGSLWCWGHNAAGQLGIGSLENMHSPVRVQPAVWGSLHGEMPMVDVACGGGHTCALQSNGTVWCWGQIGQGQLGLEAFPNTNQPWPLVVSGAPDGVVSLVAGFRHTCALTAAREVWCWGDTLGQTALQIPEPTWSFLPRKALTTNQSTNGENALVRETISSIHAGYGSTCVMAAHGAVWCWGLGSSGQLGLGETSTSELPVRAKLPDAVSNYAALAAEQASSAAQPVRSVSVGKKHSCAALGDGSLWCWGSGGPGLLGVPPDPARDPWVPVKVQVPAWEERGVEAIKVKVEASHACSVMSDASLWCWGANGRGQLGVGSTVDSVVVPVQVWANRWGLGGGQVRALSVSTQAEGTCALIEDGTVRCWGYGARGRLGSGDEADQSLPHQVAPEAWGRAPGMQAAVCMDTTEASGIVLLDDSTVWTWGANFHRHLGVERLTTEFASSPVQVMAGTWGRNDTAEGISLASVHAGGGHACALLADGSLWCWGLGVGGQLGQNSTVDHSLPVQVASEVWGDRNASVHIVAVNCGTRSTCVLLNTGAVNCWGDVDMSGLTGQTGVVLPDLLLPQMVQPGAWGDGAVASIHAGWGGACVITAASGSLWCMGNGGNGRLGLRSNSTQVQHTSVTHANADIWSCLQPSKHAPQPQVALMYAITGPGLPVPRLCPQEGSSPGASLPPWAGAPGSSSSDMGASWQEVHAGVGGAVRSSAGGGWPATASVLPPLGLLQRFMQRNGHVAAADQALHMGAVRSCSNASMHSRHWQAHPWLSPSGGRGGYMQHVQAGAGAGDPAGTSGDEAGLHCGQWQSVLVVLPAAPSVPLLLHGSRVSAPMASALVLLLDAPASLHFSVLAVQYGSGGNALPREGGVLQLHLDVQLSSPVCVSVALRELGGRNEKVICRVLRVEGNVVSCVAPGGVGAWEAHVSVDRHAARGAVHVQYEKRLTVCVGA